MSGGGRFDLDNARLPELLPYQRSFYENDHEAEIQALAIALFNEHIAPAMFDVNVLGNPHLGSIDLVRRSVNADGLALLSGEGEAAETRFLYRAWKGRNRNGRGLQFFRTYMQMLYPNAWRVNQLYQNPVFPYGLGMLTESEASGQYGSAGIAVDDLVLTSRVRVSIDYNAPLATSFSEMRKILQSVLPARLTPEFSTKIDVSTGGVGIGSDAIGIAHIIEMPTPFHCSSIARAAVTQAQFILKPNPAATLNASAHCPALSFSVFPLVIRPEPMPPDSWENWESPSYTSNLSMPISLHISASAMARLDDKDALRSDAVGQVAFGSGPMVIRPDKSELHACAVFFSPTFIACPLVMRPEQMPNDAWKAWEKPQAHHGLSIPMSLHIRTAVIARPSWQEELNAATIGQVSIGQGNMVLRLDPMPYNAWMAWADFVSVPEEGTVDDFYAGLVSGYASRKLPNWHYGPDSTTSVVQILNAGLLPF